MSNFNKCLLKGDVGEEIVDRIFVDKNWIPMGPTIKGSHIIDRIYIQRGTYKMLNVDIKTKPRRIKYYDTGIDEKDWNHYQELYKVNNIKTFLFFVDEVTKTIYGNTIDKLSECVTIAGETYPRIEGSFDNQKLIYFHLDSFKKVMDLTEDQVNILKGFNRK